MPESLVLHLRRGLQESTSTPTNTSIPIYEDDYNTPASTILFFAFGGFIMFLVFILMKMHQAGVIQEQEALEEQALDAGQAAQKRRLILMDRIKKGKLLLVR